MKKATRARDTLNHEKEEQKMEIEDSRVLLSAEGEADSLAFPALGVEIKGDERESVCRPGTKSAGLYPTLSTTEPAAVPVDESMSHQGKVNLSLASPV